MADIGLEVDVQPMIKQPYKLSEYYEDEEVTEEETVWAKPGHDVNQTGNRWPNSLTLDSASPAADTEACLRRTQQQQQQQPHQQQQQQAGSVHSLIDLVWSFTQVDITHHRVRSLHRPHVVV